MTLRIIAGKFKGRLLKTPKTATTRPTQSMLREALFNICQNSIENARFLDLFAGSGAVGFEALSRGASYVAFIEKERSACLCIQDNIQQLQVQSQSSLFSTDYRVALKRFTKYGELFDIVYIDPPYHQKVEPILEDLLQADIMKPKALLFVEQRSSNVKPFVSSKVTFIDSRKFGDALLQQYSYQSQ